MPVKVGAWLFLVVVISSVISFAFATNPQGESLLSWRRTLSGSPVALSDWDADDPTPCYWFGVSCDTSGRVAELRLEYVDLFGRVPSNLTALGGSLVRLVLAGTNLSGPIPPQLGNDLPQLELLDLSNNALTGAIPDGLCRPGSRLERLHLNSNQLEGRIPDSIGNLASLKWLILYDNQLDGTIPPSIGQMSSLQVLRAGGNKNLGGTLPWEIGNCSRLEMLGLAETGISGELPASIGQLKRLRTLAIYTALLSGAIPPEIGECSELENIYLYENSITGSMPAQLGKLNKLKNLLIWQNNLVGTIPAELGYCTELSVIDLSVNGLTGPMPVTLGNLTALQELQLSVNQISGRIPAEISNCGNITDLELDNNQISGEIPPELGRLGNLRVLYLWDNRLVGNIPMEIGRCRKLEAVDLSQNALTGAVPKELFALPRLAKLLLLGNDLSGEIPPEIGECSSLIRFRANMNRITGRIPPEIGNLKNLSFLDLGSNRISGMIPAEFAGCRNLTFVDLHSNSISGEIPERLFEGLILLQYLDLSNNSIAGELPADLGMLKSLTKLILGGNRFSGEIPTDIGSCSRLQLLDLGENLLSGEIPANLGKIPAMEIGLNLSGNGLSGSIPAEFAGLVRLSVLDISHNRLSGDLRPLASLQNLVSLNVSYNNFSGSLPSNPFFSKLPVADLEANPSLCFSQCSSSEKITSKSPLAARVATAVLLVFATLLSISAFVFLIGRRTRGGNGLADQEKDGELASPWEVTLYQKADIVIADVARGLVAANAVGHGWSGTVYRVPMPLSGSSIAVKRFRVLDEAGVAAFEAEVGILSRIRHRNIVRLLGWAANSRTRLLFYDYLPNGTLGSLLHNGVGGAVAVEWGVRLGIVIGVAEGLAYLHHDCVPGIIHRDVKAENVLLGERYEACLADFGLARAVDESRGSIAPPFAGSYGYIAPEYGCMTKITKKSDVYSFGVLLLEIITGRKPAATDPSFPEGQNVVQWARDHLRNKGDPAEILDSRLQGRPEAQLQEMLQALGIALLCASSRPDDRPTMKDVAALLREIRHIDSPGASGKAGSGGGESQKLAFSSTFK